MILQEFPAFLPQWNAHLAAWNPTLARPIAVDLAAFTDFAIDLVGTGDESELDRLAATIELMLVDGDPVVNYSVRQLLLAKLASNIQLAGLPIEQFVRRLRPQTAAYWQVVDLARHGDISIHH